MPVTGMLRSTISYRKKEEPTEGKVRLFGDSSFEQVIQIPTGVVKTSRLSKELGNLEAFIQDTGEELTVRTVANQAFFVFAFALTDGLYKPFTMEIEGMKDRTICSPGDMGLMAPAVQPILHFPPHHANHFYNILIDIHLLYPFAEEYGNLLPPQFLETLKHPASIPYYQITRFTPCYGSDPEADV